MTTAPAQPSRPAPAQGRCAFADNVRTQVARTVVGQEVVVERVLIALLTGGHLLLEGVPGVGKTMLVRTLARAVSLTFSRLQFTPDLMPADITGTTVVHEEEGSGRRKFVFQPGPVFTQILLADEGHGKGSWWTVSTR